MSLFYKQNAAARFFVDQTNGKVYEVAAGVNDIALEKVWIPHIAYS